jgi:hypothetical protein
MKYLFIIPALLLCTATIACGKPPNPLIGNWRLYAEPGTTSSPYCATPLVFTATTQTMTSGGKASSTNAVYNAAQTATYPTTVYVSVDGNFAIHITYIFSSKDRMKMDTFAGCTYERF